MRVILILVSLCVSLRANSINPRLLEGIIQPIIKRSIDSAHKTAVENDPFHIENEELTLMGRNIQLEDIHLEGFSNFSASSSKIHLFTRTLDVEIRTITADVGNWQANDTDFYGDGTVNVTMRDLKVSFTIKIDLHPFKVTILKLNNHSLGNAQVAITGVYNDDQINQQYSDDISYLLNHFLNDPSYTEKISAVLIPIMESILKSAV